MGVFSTASSAESRPSTWTMFVCTANPSRTWATSRMYTVASPTCFTGRSFSVSRMSGEELVRMLYSMFPILAVPAGRMTFWFASAVETSEAESPLA